MTDHFQPDLRAICSHLGGSMSGAVCRAPAPGKSRANRSLVVMHNPAVHGGVAVHLHNANGDRDAALAVKDRLADAGLLPAFAPGACRTVERDHRADRQRQRAEREAVERKVRRAGIIWQETAPMVASVAWRYLQDGRGLALDACPPSLRAHRRVPFWHDDGTGWHVAFVAPAMVALIVNGSTGRPQGVHVTFLAEPGVKHPDAVALGGARKMKGVAKGGCVRMGEVGEVRAVAEGVESALSYTALHGVPCDAALSADGVKHYVPPPGTKALHIAHDVDASGVGERAARDLARRMAALGVAVRFTPSPTGSDWNEHLQRVDA